MAVMIHCESASLALPALSDAHMGLSAWWFEVLKALFCVGLTSKLPHHTKGFCSILARALLVLLVALQDHVACHGNI